MTSRQVSPDTSNQSSTPRKFHPISRSDDPVHVPLETITDSLQKLFSRARCGSSRINCATEYLSLTAVEESLTDKARQAIVDEVQKVLDTPKGKTVALEQIPTVYDLLHAATESERKPWSTTIPSTVLYAALKDLFTATNHSRDAKRLREALLDKNEFCEKWDEYKPWKQLECVGYVYEGIREINKVKRKLNEEGITVWNAKSDAAKEVKEACPTLENLKKIVEWDRDSEPFSQIVAKPRETQPKRTIDEIFALPRPVMPTFSSRTAKPRPKHPVSPCLARVRSKPISKYTAQSRQGAPSARRRAKNPTKPAVSKKASPEHQQDIPIDPALEGLDPIAYWLEECRRRWNL